MVECVCRKSYVIRGIGNLRSRDRQMTYHPTSPFRRACKVVPVPPAPKGPAPLKVDKWVVLRDLTTARKQIGVTDRQLFVLQTLLGFLKETDLAAQSTDKLIVHPSNETLSGRLNGMPCSTLRRHLAILVDTGLIRRRDSPNGKRFVRRYRSGQRDVFGLDLSPLVERASQIAALAEAVRADADRLDRLRRTVSLMRRDLAALASFGGTQHPDLPLWDRIEDLARLTARTLRRALSLEELSHIEQQLNAALSKARDVLDPAVLSTNDAQNERHQQDSEKDYSESETADPGTRTLPQSEAPTPPTKTRIPLSLILSACPEILTYGKGSIRHWHDLQRAAQTVYPMMGISTSAWEEAVERMGPEQASATVAAILQRFEMIRSPGGYLRNLARRASEQAFTIGPMMLALTRLPNAVHSCEAV